MEGIDYVALISRWLHIGAVVIAIGGAFFNRVVLTPAIESRMEGDAKADLVEAIRRRWMMTVHACIAVLLLSGGYNLFRAFKGGLSSTYHIVFGIKFVLVLAVFAIAIMLTSKRPYISTPGGARRAAGILVGLGLVIILLSGILRSLSS